MTAEEALKKAVTDKDLSMLQIAQVQALIDLKDTLRAVGGDVSEVQKELRHLSDVVGRLSKVKWETGV